MFARCKRKLIGGETMRRLLVLACILGSFQFAQDLEAVAGINIDGIIYTED